MRALCVRAVSSVSFRRDRCTQWRARCTFDMLWSATPLSRACSSRSVCPPCSRRRWSASVRRSASGCCYPAAVSRRSAASPTSSASRARRCASPSRHSCRAATWCPREGAGAAPSSRSARRLAEQDGELLGDAAWAVLDLRVATEVGAAILAAERCRRGAARPARRPRGEDVGRRELRGVPPCRHQVPHRCRRGGPLAAPRARDDRGAGAGERPDRADRTPGPGPDALERAAPAARRVVSPR